jgi:hypothetical protein
LNTLDGKDRHATICHPGQDVLCRPISRDVRFAYIQRLGFDLNGAAPVWKIS